MPREVCQLCKTNQAVEEDLEKAKFKSANKLLQRLFECYNIDVTILGEDSCLCEPCLDEVSRMSECLEEWSKAQEDIRDKALEIDDSEAFQVKFELPSEDEEQYPENYVEQTPGKDDEEQQPGRDDEEQSPGKEGESSSEEYYMEGTEEGPDDENDDMKLSNEQPFQPSPEDFFSVGLASDGLAITKFFKDRTKATRMVCTCCDQVLEILAHVRMHSGRTRPNPTYYCRVCGSDFPTSRELQRHIVSTGHTKSKCGGRDLEFFCLKCHQIFPRYFDVIRHENSAHSASHPICMECNVSFKSLASYERHMKEHSTESELPKVFQCRYQNCSQRFRLWSRFAAHMKWHNGRGHLCPHAGCNEEILPGNFMIHMRTHLQPWRLHRMGQFMTLDPSKRVTPDVRKVPYDKRQFRAQKARTFRPQELVQPHPSSGGQFISLPKKISLQQGKYISVERAKEPRK
ncbi:zinc finger protein 236 [Drosophila biarmipes]|uniref:zinc finger protein 236 n=1 Tax=Drosophila biarmipes TaxID=125945 RepID=UPI0021CCBA07|nr:zinc finger protein 236 [Drosophila biarmipes]